MPWPRLVLVLVVVPPDAELVTTPLWTRLTPELVFPALELDDELPPPTEPALLDENPPEAEPAIEPIGAAGAAEPTSAMATADA